MTAPQQVDPQQLVAHIQKLEAKIAELEEEKATDESILLAIGNGLVVVDMDKRIVMVNTAFESLLGWTMEEVLGKQFGEIIIKQDEKGDPISSEKRYQTIESPIAHQTGKDNFYYVRKNKTRFPVSITTAPIIQDDSQIGIVQIFKDITEEKAIERSKNEFVSLASHQLRTPLSSINWYAEMLEGEESENEELTGYVSEIEKAGRRMTNIVNALMNISRLELGTFDLEPKEVNIKDKYEEIEKDLRPTIDEKEINYSIEINEEIGTINISELAIEAILYNLIHNSIKYTPEKGSVVVKIYKYNSELIISVADNGYGIPQEEQDQVFTKLFRGSNIRKIDTDGTGVGLFIVKSIVDLLNGKIQFKSELNRGTAFVVQVVV